jgi:transcriptional regulator with XRE-family HTH domain
MELGEKLQELRKQRGLTQEELAAALFVSRTAISKWESGRGYPSIDSLRAISRFFSVSIDNLLSTDEVLAIAGEDCEQQKRRFFSLTYGLLDCGAAMLLFLPLFGQAAEGVVREVSLLALTGVSSWLKAVFIALVTATALLGVAALALQSVSHSLWTRCRTGLSLLLSSAGVLLFILTRQPYAAVLLFAFLAAKAWMLLKER